MAATLHQQLAGYGASALLATQGETAVYTPRGLAARSIRVLVQRGTLMPRPAGAPTHMRGQRFVRIRRTDAPNPNPGGDRIALAADVGDDATTTYTFGPILNQDGEFWLLELV